MQRSGISAAALFSTLLTLGATARAEVVNASEDKFGKPTSLAPDLFYAVSDTVQIGLLHTGPMGWQSRPGVGLCLTGTANGCSKIYDNVGVDFMYGLFWKFAPPFA
jgi:hypothetical protein